jgi:hypothetical protein
MKKPPNEVKNRNPIELLKKRAKAPPTIPIIAPRMNHPRGSAITTYYS